ncbi:hypothetical protein SANTM175S_01900 [Streptomyces antimycoticus]
MPSMGAKSAMVMAWPSSPMAAYAVPTPMSAVAIGSSVAASEPKARKRTTAATPTPMASLRWADPVRSVSPAPTPPISTSRPRAPEAAERAVSSTRRTSASPRSAAGSRKTTVA